MVGLEILILLALNRMPRGLGWVLAPIMAGIVLARVAPSLVAKFPPSGGRLWHASRGVRLATVLSALWLFGAPLYCWLFEPYGAYMSSGEYTHMFKVMLFPVVAGAVAYVAYVKLVVFSPRPPARSDAPPAVERMDTTINETSGSRP